MDEEKNINDLNEKSEVSDDVNEVEINDKEVVEPEEITENQIEEDSSEGDLADADSDKEESSEDDNEEMNFENYYDVDEDAEKPDECFGKRQKEDDEYDPDDSCYSSGGNNMGAVLGVVLIIVCLMIFVFSLPSNKDSTAEPVSSPSLTDVAPTNTSQSAKEEVRVPSSSHHRDTQKPAKEEFVSPEPSEELNIPGTIAVSAKDIYKATVDSVVEINCITAMDYGYTGGFESGVYSAGFIVDSNGFIFTNAHVVENATDIFVTLHNGDIYDAELVGVSELHDLAILKINATGLTPVRIGTNGDLSIGDTVYAIGHPLDLDYSMSSGIVSSPERLIQDMSGKVLPLIQIDCAINEGNSGGPLLNSRGEVIGITNSKFAGGTIERIGFAVPIDIAINDYLKLLNVSSQVNQSYLGITYVMVDEETADNFNFVPGAFVHSVDLGSSAEKYGIMANDIIVGVSGQPVNVEHSLIDAVSNYRPGDTITLYIWRNGQQFAVDVVLGYRPINIDSIMY